MNKPPILEIELDRFSFILENGHKFNIDQMHEVFTVSDKVKIGTLKSKKIFAVEAIHWDWKHGVKILVCLKQVFPIRSDFHTNIKKVLVL